MGAPAELLTYYFIYGIFTFSGIDLERRGELGMRPRLLFMVFLLALVSFFHGPPVAQAEGNMFLPWWERLFPLEGLAVASWYGPGFHGKTMASGKRFNMFNPHVVAHKTLPLGTRVRIVNPVNLHSVDVFVADRGPYIAGRDFDLSFAAAQRLGLVRAGVATVYFTVLER